jgi:exonuclease III
VFSPSRCKTLTGSKTLIIIAAYAPHMGHHKGKARNVRRFYTNLAKFKAELLQDDPKAVIIMGGD